MKKNFILFFVLILTSLKGSAQTTEKNKFWPYPLIKSDSTVDYYFGKKVIDPFRNLENVQNEPVKAWMKKQNELYDSIIHNITNRDSLAKEIGAMQQKRKKWADSPRPVGNRIFYTVGYFNDQDIERLVYMDSLHKEPVEIFNTKEINKKDTCTYNFNYYEPSFDGKHIAFGISANGSEMANIFIMDVEKKYILPERIERCKAGNIQWLPDGKGFFYIKEKEILTEEDKKTPYEDRKVKLHKLYSNSKNDKEIFSRLLNKNLNLEKIESPILFVYPLSNMVLMNTSKGVYNTAVYYASLNDVLNQPGEKIIWKKICGENEKISVDVLQGNRFFGLSYKQNPNGQLIMMDLSNLKPKVLYNAVGFSLEDIALTNHTLYLTTLENGFNRLVKIDLQNFSSENIKLPFLGALNLNPNFSVASSYHPSDFLLFTLMRYDKQLGGYLCNQNQSVIKTNIFPEVQFMDPSFDLVVNETEIPSHDSVMVPLSIIYKKGMKFDGNNPTIIEAYGAYGISKKSEFNRNRLAWFNHGGIYAIAHVRGGGEKGDNWYKGGVKATKPNSWKDLIACEEYLINNKYTSPQKLALTGYSAGGITVGRAITERPDLVKTAVIYVGFLNTIRMENTFNPAVEEFGTAKDSLEFQYLYNMDTYHHIREGVTYPSVMFTAGLNDARVAPWQPAKAVAKMQQVSKGNNIVLFRVADTGHFDYPSDADVYSFLFWQLGHPDFKLKQPKPLQKGQ